MAMKSYDNTYEGPSYFFDGWTGQAYIQRFGVIRKSLNVIVAQSGDYRTPTPHMYVKTSHRGYEGTIVQRYNWKVVAERRGAHPYVYNYASFLPSDFEYAAEASALSEALETLRGTIDLSVDLVQWRQVIKMTSLYRRATEGIARQARHLLPAIERGEKAQKALAILERRSKNPRGHRAKRLARELNSSLNYIASKRLEYVYGWKPTASSLYDLAQLAMHPKAPGMLVCKGKGKVLQKKTFTDSSISSKVDMIHTLTQSDRCRLVLYFNPAASVLDDLGKISSLNPVAVFYEATPFSFCLDWLYDFGGWIRNLETAFLHKNDFTLGYKTLTQKCYIESDMQGEEIDFWDSSRRAEYSLKGYATQTRLTRLTLSEMPFQVIPQRQFKFGVQRQLNAIALAKVVLLRADKLLAGRR